MEKGKKLEWLMAVILLSAAYVLSREGARLVAAQKAATKVVVLDSGHGGDDPGKIGANGFKRRRKTGALHAGCTGRGARSGESQESQGKQNVLHAEEDRCSAGDLRVRIPLKSGGGSAPEHKGVPEKGGGCTV